MYTASFPVDDIKLKDCLLHEINKRFAESEIKGMFCSSRDACMIIIVTSLVVFKLQKKMDDMMKRLDEVHDMMKNYLVRHPPVGNIQELEETPTHVD